MFILQNKELSKHIDSFEKILSYLQLNESPFIVPRLNLKDEVYPAAPLRLDTILLFLGFTIVFSACGCFIFKQTISFGFILSDLHTGKEVKVGVSDFFPYSSPNNGRLKDCDNGVQVTEVW